MKSLNKNYFWGLGLALCLVLGFFLGKSFFTPSGTYIEAPDAIYVARDITSYTNQADVIVVGTVREVNDPYITSATGITLLQDAQVDVLEVLKGDRNMKNVKVSRLADQIEGFSPENISALKGKTGLLKPGEKVLLFLGKDSAGDFVVFGGPYGKYLIDEINGVSGEGDFRMTLDHLKSQIQETLKSPAPPYQPPTFSEQV